MQANSWLYHYYMVQSKLQYGLAYESNTASRMVSYYQAPTHQPHATIVPSYVQHHEPPIGEPVHHEQRGYMHSPRHGHHHHHQHQHHHGGPPHLHDGLTQQRQQPAYSEKAMVDAEPVDYSVSHSLHIGKGSPDHYHSRSSPVPLQSYAKRKSKFSQNSEMDHMNEMNESTGNCSPEEVIVDLDAVSSANCGGDGGLLCVMPTAVSSSTAIQSINKPRIMLKVATNDPAEFIEQWNPSPPWSDTLQKVPDIMHHDLSPYVTTTPPTPSGTPGETNSHMAFTFDWMPEQYVPNVITPPAKLSMCEEDYHGACWSEQNHRIFNLQPPPRGHGSESIAFAEQEEPTKQEPLSPVVGMRSSPEVIDTGAANPCVNTTC